MKIPVTDTAANKIILTQLDAIRDDLGDVKNRLSGVEASLATMLQDQGHLDAQVAQVQIGVDHQNLRIDRIEDRLGLIDAG